MTLARASDFALCPNTLSPTSFVQPPGILAIPLLQKALICIQFKLQLAVEDGLLQCAPLPPPTCHVKLCFWTAPGSAQPAISDHIWFKQHHFIVLLSSYPPQLFSQSHKNISKRSQPDDDFQENPLGNQAVTSSPLFLLRTLRILKRQLTSQRMRR